MSRRQVAFSSGEQTTNDNRSYASHQQSYNTTLQITVSNRDNPKEQRKPRNNKPNDPPQVQPPKPNNAGAWNIKELSSKHLQSLKNTFNKVIHEKFLSKVEYEQYLSIYNQLQKIILDKHPDAQVVLYGSTLFECALKGTSMIDIDVQFNDTLPYDTLKELLNIIRNSGLCQEAHMNIDDEVLSVDVKMSNSNIAVRLTSNNISAVQLSRVIQTYMKFDRRVLPLLRIFRFFSKICYLDQRDEGTLHPTALYVMVIYFLQQLDPPVLPCLHEYVFGIDKTPVTLINEQYVEFFQVCNEYINRWKSTNVTSVEMLFLQLLSFFARRFQAKRFDMSIKTRMPLIRNNNKRIVNRRSLFCADPIYINRNLCYSLKTGYLFIYFHQTLAAALNYFCETPKSENQKDNLYYTVTNCDEAALRKHLFETVHKSYQLFIEHFPNRNDFWNYVTQDDLRQLYKKTFDPVKNPIPEAILKLKEKHTIQLFDDDSDYEDDDDDDDDGTAEEISHENINEQTTPNSQKEDQEEIVVEKKPDQKSQVREEEPVLFKTLAEHLDEKQTLILHQQYSEQVRLFNDKMQQILNEIKSTTLETDVLTSELFYDMQAKNFGVNQKPPTACSICFGYNHAKANCPELSLPLLVTIPKANQRWISVVTHICEQITDQCKPRKEDTDIREEIVEYLKNECRKCYPSCCIHVYGSSQNGFSFRQSDLDLCIELKENKDESDVAVFEKLVQNLQLQTAILKDIEFIRDARIPIIRSKHSKFDIEIDISLNNILAVENTRLLKTYAQIDNRVPKLGYMIKYLVKKCDICDVKTGTLSSYAYILMLIHFLQQFRPSVLPVLQQLDNNSNDKKNMLHQWNVYFYDDLTKLKQVWINKSGSNMMSAGELWIEFLRYYTERFDYKNNVVTIRQMEPLRRDEKGWFNPTIAIEDPFILTHNLADKLSLKKWSRIQRILIRAREGFALAPKDTNIQQAPIHHIQEYLFDVEYLCQDELQKFNQFNQKSMNRKRKKSAKNHPDQEASWNASATQ